MREIGVRSTRRRALIETIAARATILLCEGGGADAAAHAIVGRRLPAVTAAFPENIDVPEVAVHHGRGARPESRQHCFAKMPPKPSFVLTASVTYYVTL